ncbi:MAG: flagellar biosynthetic protein FliO [Halobacteriovoraceae bacterium]|nr:flagellar biosynthetic protein FliO [Halobacteriovoraceae bacterium]
MKLLSIFIILITNALASQSPRVTDVSTVLENEKLLEISVKISEKLLSEPELILKDNIIQLSLPQTVAWPKIDKVVVDKKSNIEKLLAYQYDKNTVRIRALLDSKVKIDESNLRFTQRNGEIIIHIPKLNSDAYDDKLLNKLLKDKSFQSSNENLKVKEDEVRAVLSSSEKKNEKKDGFLVETKKFSIIDYLSKVIGFLALLIFGGYLLKRNFSNSKKISKQNKKNGLKIFRNKGHIQVIENHFLGGKKNLSLVQVGNQVFLVGISDNSISLVSEIDTVENPIFEEDKEFAPKLENASHQEKEFYLKDIAENTTDEVVIQNEIKNENIKLSDQIKNKVKNLKRLQ